MGNTRDLANIGSGRKVQHITGRNTVLNQEPITQAESTRTGMTTTIYTGNGTSQSIDTGVDMVNGELGGLVWLKSRGAASHVLFDTVRGADKGLISDGTDIESTTSGTDLLSFNANGFSLGTATVFGSSNTTDADIVAWSFQTNKKTTGLTNRNKAYTAHYNADMGFSIVGYEGDGVDGHEIPHHLGVEPELSIFKDRDTVTNWFVQGNHIGSKEAGDFVELNSTIAIPAANATNRTFYDNKNVRIGSNAVYNASTKNVISYHFRSIEGVSKIGNYIGTGAAGNYVECGFKPSFVMIKSLTNVNEWVIVDAVRGDKRLYPSNSVAENTLDLLDFDDNGFVCKTTGNGANDLNQEFIFIAFSENTATFGSELVSNGTFDTDITGWSVNGTALIAHDTGNGGQIHVDRNGGVSGSGATTSITTVAGTVYELSFDVNQTIGTSEYLSVFVGTTSGGLEIGTISSSTDGIGTFKGSFVAVGTTTHLTLAPQNDVNAEFYIDNVSVKEVTAPHGVTYSYPTTPDTFSIQNNTVISLAKGFDDNGSVNSQFEFTGNKTHTLGAGFENKHLYVYSDKDGNIGTTEYRPLSGLTRNDADRYGEVSPSDASLRTTSKHFDYESDSGVALASGYDGTDYPWAAFNKDDNDMVGAAIARTQWLLASTTTSWLQYKHNEKRILKSWKLRAPLTNARAPKRFTIEGSNDGLNWTAIDSTYTTSDYISNGGALWGNLQDTSANTTAYLYHRINITANNGDATYTAIAELELNTITPSDYYIVTEGKMFDNNDINIERTYLGEVITNDNGEVSSYENYPVSKQYITEAEVHKDLSVYGEIHNEGVCTAWVNFDGTQNPPLIKDSYNVKDVVDISAGQYEIIFEDEMDIPSYNVSGTHNQVAGDITSFTAPYPPTSSYVMTKERVRILTSRSAGPIDPDLVSVRIFGGKKIK